MISGGQTGVDRAALDAAFELALECGGWVPAGRRAEDGPVDARYPLRETAAGDYETRTRLNVRDSDATLILTRGRPSGGTALTVRIAEAIGRPIYVVDLDETDHPASARAWLAAGRFRVLNVAGPRESGAPGIRDQAKRFLTALLAPEAPITRR